MLLGINIIINSASMNGCRSGVTVNKLNSDIHLFYKLINFKLAVKINNIVQTNCYFHLEIHTLRIKDDSLKLICLSFM